MSNYYNNISLDEICMRFRLNTQNLLHEMDISILCKEYNYLLENGYTIEYDSIHEASDVYTKLKNVFNKWKEWFKNFFRMVKDTLIESLEKRLFTKHTRIGTILKDIERQFPDINLKKDINYFLREKFSWSYRNLPAGYKYRKYNQKAIESIAQNIADISSPTDVDKIKKNLEKLFATQNGKEKANVSEKDVIEYFTSYNIQDDFDHIHKLYTMIHDSCSDDIKAYKNDSVESTKCFKEKLNIATNLITRYVKYIDAQNKLYPLIMYKFYKYMKSVR